MSALQEIAPVLFYEEVLNGSLRERKQLWQFEQHSCITKQEKQFGKYYTISWLLQPVHK